MVATDLIAAGGHSDRLFCVAVGFLALVFAASTITGVIMLLLHRPLGRLLIAGGAVVALLTYGGVFIAGARVAGSSPPVAAATGQHRAVPARRNRALAGRVTPLSRSVVRLGFQ